MPSFDLRNIFVAPYTNNAGTESYGTPLPAGDAMTANLELKYAEGRLYAESSLAEYLKKCISGTISLGVKYIPNATQVAMYGAVTGTRLVGETSVPVLKYGKTSTGKYMGVAFYAPDMIDGEEKFTCCFVIKSLFGPPSMTFNTLGESLSFQTPTTTGEFLPGANGQLLEVGVADTEADAINWCKAVFGAEV